jgi:HMG (high mobility group) box
MPVTLERESMDNSLPSPNTSFDFPTVVTPNKNFCESGNEASASGVKSQLIASNSVKNDVVLADFDKKSSLPISHQYNEGPGALTSMLASVVTGTSSRKAHMDKPRRPLSAYNIFFQLQRERILNDEADSSDTTTGFTDADCERIVSNVSRQRISSSDGSGAGGSSVDPAAAAAAALKRKHRKSHGKIGFAELARTIAAKWKNVDPEMKERFEKYSTTDKKRYRTDIDAYNKYMMSVQASLAKSNNSMNKIDGQSMVNPVSSASDRLSYQSKSMAKVSSSLFSASNPVQLTVSSSTTNLSKECNQAKDGNIFSDSVQSSYSVGTNNRNVHAFSQNDQVINQEQSLLSQSPDRLKSWTGQQFEHPARRRVSMPSLAYPNSTVSSYSPSQQMMMSNHNSVPSGHQFSRRHSSAALATTELEKDKLDDIHIAKMNNHGSFNSLKNLAMGNYVDALRNGHRHTSSNAVDAIRQQKQYLKMKSPSNSMNRLVTPASLMSNPNKFTDAYNVADEAYYMAHEMLPNDRTDQQGFLSNSDTLKKRHSQPNFAVAGTSTASDVSNLLPIQHRQQLLLQKKQRQYLQNQQHELRRLQKRRQIVRMQRELQQEQEMMNLGIHRNELLEQEMMLIGDDENFHDENMVSNDNEDLLIKELLQQDLLYRQGKESTNINDPCVGLAYDEDDDVDFDDEGELGLPSSDYLRQLQAGDRVQRDSFKDDLVEEQRLQQMYIQLRQEEEMHLRSINSNNHDDDLLSLVGSNAANGMGTTRVSSSVSGGDAALAFNSNSEFPMRGDPRIVDFGPFLTTKAPN